MMERIVDVDNVDHPVASLNKWNVIVGDRTLRFSHKDAAVSELERLAPYPVDHFRGPLY